MKNVRLKRMEDGSLKVKILILNITTYAKNESDVVNAVEEAIEALKINARKANCVETFKLISLWYNNK